MSNRFPSAVPEVVPRLVAAQVVLLAAVALAFGQAWILPLLALDFGLRAVGNPRWSPLSRIARALAPRIAPASPRVPFAPKRFAAGLGLAFTAGATGLVVAGLPAAAGALVGLLATCAAFEAGIGFCVGCAVYNGLVRARLLRTPACVECAAWTPGLRTVRRD